MNPFRLPAAWRAAGLALLPPLALALALACVAPPVAAHDHGSRGLPPDLPAAYTQECTSCHTAYPPGMLPAPSWQRVMAGLGRHYGSDASIDLAAQQQIGAWLQRYAGTYKRVDEAPPQDRITRSAWFERKHRKIDTPIWALPSVKSAANCEACHAGAARGRFDDDDLRVPAGVTLRQRLAWFD